MATVKAEETNDVEKLLTGLFVACLMVVLVWSEGFVLMKLWSWFACPVFGIRTISVGEAIGLRVMVALFRFKDSTDNKSSEKMIERGLVLISFAWFMLFIGWVASHLG